ncbi:MAG: DUF1592 domain-containing protein [Pseudomonadales bacterium]|jgi:hypothetical protein|nr:DUF1592 domain-containing protein [Pseudomonadales bacterium]
MLRKLILPLSLLPLYAAPALAQFTPALVSDYCAKCHNFEDWAGSLDLEALDFDHVDKAAPEWELVIRKLSAGMMPPAGEPHPSQDEAKAFIAELENRLDSQVTPLPAAPALHRLNRSEYANAIRDIFGLDIDASTLLPQDDASEGFDNVASGLGISPALIQGYTNAAMKVSRQAVGDTTLTEASTAYNVSPGFKQFDYVEGLPLGTRGGMVVEHNFPLDAEYAIRIRGGGRGGGGPRIQVTLDGAQITPENPRDFRLPLNAGVHTLTVALIDTSRPTGVNDIYSVYSPPGTIDTVEIVGPFNPSGTGDTTSRQRIFSSCYPQSNDAERQCAERIAVDIATQAFRTPVVPGDIEPVMAFYEQGYREGGFEGGIQQALSRILIDPRFLFRFEEEPADVAPGEIYTISDLDLASRLSFFLWSSIPDTELLALAEQNRLHEKDVLLQQVRRMLADPKAEALTKNFAGQWLYLRTLAGVTPEARSFDDNLRQAFTQETELLFNYIVNEDRSVLDLIDADYSFINERLARHYGIPDVRGSYFRKVQLPPESQRRGVLGHGSVLTVTSSASRTSPVIRGSWILGNLLNAPVPAPPPGVETNLDGDGTVVLTSSVRERLEAHRADPTCASCHRVIDPVGFALEHFDPVGAWREYDGDSKVDSSGMLADGTPITSATDLHDALMQRSDLFVNTLTEKLFIYALGRSLDYYDMPTVRAIRNQARQEDLRFSAIVEGIVQSPQFTQRVKSGGSTDPQPTTASR